MPTSGRSLFGPASVYALVTAVQAAASVLVIPLITRQLGPAEYGVVATALVVHQILQVFMTLGFPVAAAWEVYEGSEANLDQARRLATTAVLAAMGASLLVHLLGPVWAPGLLDVEYGRALMTAVLWVVPGVGLACVQTILQAHARPRAFAACTLASAVAGQLIALALVVFTELGASGYLIGMLAGALTGGALGFGLTRTSLLRAVPPRIAWSAIRHAGPTVLHGGAFIVLASADRLLVQRALGLEAAGRYHLSYLVGSIGMVAAIALNNAWAPLVHRAPEEQRWIILRDTTAQVYRVAAVVTAGVAVAAPLALKVLAPADYRPEALTPVAAIVAASLLPYVTYLSAVHVLFQRRRVAALAVATTAAGIANVVLNLVLIPVAGLFGSGLATLLAYLLWAWMVRRAARRAAPVEWPGSAGVRSFVLAAVFVAVGAAAPATGGWLGLRAVVAGALLAWMVVRVRA